MEIFIVLIICILQIALFVVNCYKLQRFKNIFSDTSGLSINTIDGFVEGINSKINNPIFKVILSSINKYLSNNKGQVSDYHLIKDIVDRNTDAKEDEISTLIPIPLYLGLVGTMACILLGLVKLDLNTVIAGSEKSMVDGISPLLLGVAVAMITSTLGIILTTIGSYIAKNSRANVEENKNAFLSWMQEKLLPQLSNDTASVLQKMTRNLTSFNRTFAENNSQFATTLSQISETLPQLAETTMLQKDLVLAVNSIQEGRVAKTNLELLGKFIECSQQMEVLAYNLRTITSYTDNLHDTIKEIKKYFNAEREQIEQRKTLLAEAINKVDANSNAALEEFNKHFIASLQTVQETFESKIFEITETLKIQQETVNAALDIQNETFLKSIEDQQKTLAEKLQNTTEFVEELNKIGDKIASITRLEQAMKEQNGKLSNLSNEIRELAKKAGGNTIVFSIPNWIKIAIITGFGILVLSGVAYLISLIF